MVKKSKNAEEHVIDNESKKDQENAQTEDLKLSQNEQINADDNIINNDEETNEVEKLKKEIEKKDKELKEYIEIAQRVKAEFENYKKRVAREKEQLYTEISGDIITKFLPIIDNLERAVSLAPKSEEASKLMEGIEMTIKQFKDILTKEGVEEINAMGANFDPALHNAVMHINDESYGENVIVEEYQKGYKIKDRILRYSMVKVAN